MLALIAAFVVVYADECVVLFESAFGGTADTGG